MSKKPTDPPKPTADADKADTPPPKPAAEAESVSEAKGETRAPKKKKGWLGGKAAEQESALEDLRAENAELKDRVLRTMAEMENLRRRTDREKADTAKFAIANFARDALSIADNISRAVAAVPEDQIADDTPLKALLEGVQMTEREFLNTLERHGVAKVDPKGERFDPNQHQAMFEVEDKSVAEGTVVEVVQAGYMIGERILRPAMVGVAKGGAKAPKPTEQAAPEQPKAANDDQPEAKKPEPASGAKKTAAKTADADKPEAGEVGGSVDKSA